MYRQKRIFSGPMLEQIKSVKTDRPGHRSGRRKPTSEEMAANNRRQRERKLARLIALNFTPGDYCLYLSFREIPEKAALGKIAAKFFRRLRKHTPDLKYILIAEEGEKNGRLHLHLLLNKEVPYQAIAAAWEWGRVSNRAIYSDRDFRALAKYLLKFQRSTGERAWRGSRNLLRPKETVERVGAKTFRKQPAETLKLNGNIYHLMDFEEHFAPFTLENVQYAVYLLIQERKDKHERRKKRKRKAS